MIDLYADIIDYQDSIVQAIGHVKVENKDYVLKTSSLLYKAPYIYAPFLSVIQDQNKNRIISEKITLTKDQQVFAKNIQVTFEDSSQFLGYRLHQQKKDHGVLKKGSYTTCYRCRSNPTWLIKADKIEYDENDVTYRDAFLYIHGTPVFYTPYFSHPHPKVKYRGGILTPNLGKSKNLGYFSRVPLYYPFNERSDITFTPIFSAQKKPILIFENRNFRDKSYTRVGGSYADVSVKRRWHADFFTEHRINENTRFVLKVRRASDITYLLGYPIEKNVSAILPYQQKNLTSQIFWERWKNKNYTTVSGYLFQTEKQSLTPRILPYIEHDYHNHYGSFSWGSETSFTFLERSHDSNRYQRLRGDLYVQHLGLYKGNVFENTIAAKWDAYHLNKTDESKFLTSPQFQSAWSYPLTCLNFTLEPTAQLTLQDTQQGFVDGLQQEEFDTINIFRRHRMRSYDRMEKKGRVVTGIRQTFFHTNNQITQLFLGKSFPLKHDARDYVSEIKTGTSLWNISHKNAFYRHGFRYSETGIHIGQKWELSLAHIFVNRFMRPINQGQWQIKIPLKPQWNISLAQIHQLGPRQFVGEKRELSQFLSLDYHDECLKARVGFYHSQYRDKDIKPNSGFLFSLVLNNLGSYDVVSGVSYSESPVIQKIKS